MEQQIEKLVKEAFVELGYEDCFIVGLRVNNTKVEIFLDSDSSITFERCRKVSRFVESVLDEKQWLGEKYTLEVSSGGIGRPLQFLRQYIKNIDRKVEVKTVQEEKVRGILTAADAEKVVVTYEEKVKQGKKNVKVTVNKEVLMKDILETRVKISF